MILEYPAFKKMNRHLQRLVRRLFDESSSDVFEVKRYETYVIDDRQFVAKMKLGQLSAYSCHIGSSPDEAVLGLLKKIRKFCKDEKLTVKMIPGEIFMFYKEDGELARLYSDGIA